MKAWRRKSPETPSQVIMSVHWRVQLAGAGLLDNKPATTHHGYYADFEIFPNVKLRRRPIRLTDDRVFTSGGPTSESIWLCTSSFTSVITLPSKRRMDGIPGQRLARINSALR